MSLLNEDNERRPPARAVDSVSIAVGSEHFVIHHRFGNLFVQTPMGNSPRLAVSRYYWNVEPPVAVDFRKEIRYGKQEFETKSQYCKRQGIRYVMVNDKWAGEEVEDQLKELAPLEESEAPVKPLLTEPRNIKREEPERVSTLDELLGGG